MWFELPECNTLRPRENGVLLLKPGLVKVCLSLSELGAPSSPLNLLSVWSFYSKRSGSYIETQGRTCGPEVVETLYSI
jgi:hypothetical protein